MSKEDTNDNQLNNLQLAWHGPDEPSAFAEMSAKQETVMGMAAARLG